MNTLASSIQTTDWRNKLINCTCSRRDTLCHGIETPVNKTADTSCEQATRWHSLYCVATMLDALYKDRYLDANKKQG